MTKSWCSLLTSLYDFEQFQKSHFVTCLWYGVYRNITKGVSYNFLSAIVGYLAILIIFCYIWGCVTTESECGQKYVAAAEMSSRGKQPSMTTLSPHSLGYLDCNDSVVARTSIWEVASKQRFGKRSNLVLYPSSKLSTKSNPTKILRNYRHQRQLIFNQTYPNPN